ELGISPICAELATDQSRTRPLLLFAEFTLCVNVLAMRIEITFADQLVNFRRPGETGGKSWDQRIDGQLSGLDKVEGQILGILVSHGKTDCSWADAGLTESGFVKFGMGCERRTTNDGVRLAKTNHMGERWLQAVE